MLKFKSTDAVIVGTPEIPCQSPNQLFDELDRQWVFVMNSFSRFYCGHYRESDTTYAQSKDHNEANKYKA